MCHANCSPFSFKFTLRAARAVQANCPKQTVAMGCACCKRRVAEIGHEDLADEFIKPSTAWERRQRGISTTSMDSEKLVAMAGDESRPTRAAHAAAELRRRGHE